MEKELYDLTAPQKSIWLTEQYYKNTNINYQNLREECLWQKANHSNLISITRENLVQPERLHTLTYFPETAL